MILFLLLLGFTPPLLAEYEEAENTTVAWSIPNLVDEVPSGKNSTDEIVTPIPTNKTAAPSRTAILHMLGYNDSYLKQLHLPENFDTMDRSEIEDMRKKAEEDLFNSLNDYITNDTSKNFKFDLPQPKPVPSHGFIWKILIIFKLVIATIYWTMRCMDDEKKKKEREENEINLENGIPKTP